MPTEFVQLSLSSQLLIISTGHLSDTLYPVIRRIGCEHRFRVFPVLGKPTSAIPINDSCDCTITFHHDIPRRKITVRNYGAIVLAMWIDNFLSTSHFFEHLNWYPVPPPRRNWWTTRRPSLIRPPVTDITAPSIGGFKARAGRGSRSTTRRFVLSDIICQA